MLSPYAFYQFWLNVEDVKVGELLRIFTFLDHEEIEELEQQTEEKPFLRAGQKRLAEEVTSFVHGRRGDRAHQGRLGGAVRGRGPARARRRHPRRGAPRGRGRRGRRGERSRRSSTCWSPRVCPRAAAQRAVRSSEGGAYLNNERVADPEFRPGTGDVVGGRVAGPPPRQEELRRRPAGVRHAVPVAGPDEGPRAVVAVRRHAAGQRPRAVAGGGLPLLQPGGRRRGLGGRGDRGLGPVPVPASGAAGRHRRRRRPRRCWARSSAHRSRSRPTTLQRAAHPDGEVAMAEAARAGGSLVVVSSNAGTPFADIGAVGTPWWLQVYVTADRSATAPGRRERRRGRRRRDRAHRRHPCRRHEVRRRADRLGGDGSGLGPRQLLGRGSAASPRRRRRPISARTTSPGSPTATSCRSWSRGSCTRPMPAAASTPVPRPSGSPTTAGASSTGRSRRRRRSARSLRRSPVRRRCTSTGECGVVCTRLPQPPSAPARCSSADRPSTRWRPTARTACAPAGRARRGAARRPCGWPVARRRRRSRGPPRGPRDAVTGATFGRFDSSWGRP